MGSNPTAGTDRINDTLLIDRSQGGTAFRYWSPTFCTCNDDERNNQEFLAKIEEPEARPGDADVNHLPGAIPLHGDWQFVFASPLAPLVAAAPGYAAASFPPRRPVLVGLVELTARIRRDLLA